MYEKGLITSTEYDALKAKLLGIDPTLQGVRKDSLSLSKIINRKNNKLVGGVIMTTFGGGLGIGAMAWAVKETPSNNTSNNYNDRRSQRVTAQVVMGVAGVGLIIGGIVLLTESGKDTQLIRQIRKRTAFVYTSNTIGLAFKF